MKHYKFVVALILVAVMFSLMVQPSFAAQRKTPYYGKVIATRLNIREQPNTRAEIFGQVVKGDEVLVSQVQNTRDGIWYYVMVTGELEGWVLGKYIQYKRPANF